MLSLLEARLFDTAGNRLYLNAEEREAFLAAARKRRPGRADLELDREPPEDWRDLAQEMPCCVGPGMWDKLNAAELHRYILGGGLPDDYDERGEPDDLQ